MLEVYNSTGASRHEINSLAEWVRGTLVKVGSGELDIIRFIEIDLLVFFPDIYVVIEDDDVLKNKRAYVSAEPLGLVIAESVYNGAQSGSLFHMEVILHEVGHLFLHHQYQKMGLNNAAGVYRQQIRNTNLANSAEWQATTFALCVLYPYRLLRDARTPFQIKQNYKVTEKQADRILAHLGKLRARENERDRKRESAWLRSIVDRLPSKDCTKEHSHAQQLSLFYESEHATLAVAHA